MTNKTFNDTRLYNLNRKEAGVIKQLYDQYAQQLYRLCKRILLHKEEAAEVVQDVFIDIWLGKAVYAGKSSFTTWLHRVVVNKCLMKNRVKKTKNFLFFWSKKVNLSVYESIESENKNALEKMIDNEDRVAALAAIHQLPLRQKLAFTLFYLEDFSYQETAHIMSCSMASVESLLFRARKNLKTK
jgi:RNA polymerase sigma factor (sigma-70 family)